MALMTSRERILRAIRHEEVDRVPISPRYFDYLVGVEGCECPLHSVLMAERWPIDLMHPEEPRQNNYLLHHTGPYNDLPGVTVRIDTEDAEESIVIRRRFETPAGELRDARSIVKPGSTITFDHIIEAPVKDSRDFEKVKFLLPSPDEAYVDDPPLETLS
jgi:hypothetical protein